MYLNAEHPFPWICVVAVSPMLLRTAEWNMVRAKSTRRRIYIVPPVPRRALPPILQVDCEPTRCVKR